MPKTGTEPMWCVVMFDLPTKTKRQQKDANKFRNTLLDLGFGRAQLSVYVQYFPLASRIARIVSVIKSELPPGGDIRILSVTDNQWAKTIRFSNAKPSTVEKEPTQLSIF